MIYVYHLLEAIPCSFTKVMQKSILLALRLKLGFDFGSTFCHEIMFYFFCFCQTPVQSKSVGLGVDFVFPPSQLEVYSLNPAGLRGIDPSGLEHLLVGD